MSEFARVLATLRQIRGLSPFFALDVGRPDDGWHDGEALSHGPALPDALDRISDRYRTTERRVAASLFFLGYTARLLSPVVAARAVGGVAPDVRPANVWWRYRPEGLQVRLKDPLAGVGIAESMEPVVEAVHACTPVARGLLWGNAGSSVAGALRTVSRSGVDCGALAGELFADPPLKDTGEFIPFPGEVVFRRRSCCLYYRLDGGGTCGDCPLTPR
ncbi:MULTISPECIES: (2Fe-2S)-binding protein [Saccharothrix]|uniref:(2Fe-2S)-binding protein n=1 Tax=Saccharothrix TaxID=2071 RepID=UPI00093F185A|nr:(2Fe-2S)-binding protein [Saccharothrix sp. CB00851]OKI20063.1 ferric iron reductase [Saccharothrix sp. CB00851]